MMSEAGLSSNYRDGLPPGYRFKPTDVELLHHLYHKINHGVALMPDIRDVDLYSSDHPRSLTEKYPRLGDREWYFFTPRNRKYPNGGRPNRTAGSGFWRAMVADKQVVHGGEIMGFKRTLVFFSGNHKECVRTSWMMNEFRAEQNPRAKTHANDMKLDDWVLCRVYENERRLRGNRQADAHHSSSGAVVMQEDVVVNTQIDQTIDSNITVVGEDMRALTVNPPQNYHHHHHHHHQPYLDQTLLSHNNVNTQIEQSIDTNIMMVGEDMRTITINLAQDYYHPYLDQSQTLLFDNNVNIQGGAGEAEQNHCHPSLDQRVIFDNNVNIQGGGGAAAQNHYHPSLDQRVVFDNNVNHQLAADDKISSRRRKRRIVH